MIWAKLVFGGFGRRGLEAIVACVVLAVVTALLSGALMIVQGARDALSSAERKDRPDIVQVKSRFNRALFQLLARAGPLLLIPRELAKRGHLHKSFALTQSGSS